MGMCEPWKEMYAYYRTAITPLASLNLPLKSIDAEQMAEFNMEINKSYSYLYLPFVSRAALQCMNFRSIDRTSWI